MNESQTTDNANPINLEKFLSEAHFSEMPSAWGPPSIKGIIPLNMGHYLQYDFCVPAHPTSQKGEATNNFHQPEQFHFSFQLLNEVKCFH